MAAAASEALDPDRNEKFQHMEYFNFMIGQLNDTIRYSDSKHTVGMTLVVSILVASTQFIAPKLDTDIYIVRIMLNVNVASALLAVAFGYVGVFPKFISPHMAETRRSSKTPNIFYFKEISASDTRTLRDTIDAAFPNSTLSDSYRNQASVELYALSCIAMRKFTTFRYFLYALFFFLVTLGWLFATTFIDLSGSRG